MLFNSFAHIPGIGAATERRIWEEGVHHWDDFVEPWPAGFTGRRGGMVVSRLAESRARFHEGARAIGRLLRNNLHWRLFPHFRHATACLDIETTGRGPGPELITAISLYDGTSIFTFVRGDNLEEFVQVVGRYEVLITYNGRCFDVPVLERAFGIRLDQVHIDLRFLLQELGVTGGLKVCEKKLGIHRGELEGVDGFFAVLLWREYERTGSRAALHTLLAYNIADTVNLEILMVHAYNRKVAQTPLGESLFLPLPLPPLNPYSPDRHLVEAIRHRSAIWFPSGK
ncbi:MAG: ribonuclease H-like domain-containing protein [Desulfobulbaceae bacterium]|nr:ribonuclease H-like domain-containing protein [Desulfobulbaceae bacterium]